MSLLLPLLLSCVAIHPISGDDLCDEVGFGIAQRTLDCTGDHDLSNQRYREFTKALTCSVNDPTRAPVDRYLECPAAVNAMDCADLKAYGKDIAALVGAASPQCSRLFEEIESADKPDDFAPPHNGVGVNPFFDVGPGVELACPAATLGADVDITVNNPRSLPVVLMQVDQPCDEVGPALVVPAAGSAQWTTPAGSLVRVRTIEGSLISDQFADDGLVVEVAP